jgi:hypothetical protein
MFFRRIYGMYTLDCYAYSIPDEWKKLAKHRNPYPLPLYTPSGLTENDISFPICPSDNQIQEQNQHPQSLTSDNPYPITPVTHKPIDFTAILVRGMITLDDGTRGHAMIENRIDEKIALYPYEIGDRIPISKIRLGEMVTIENIGPGKVQGVKYFLNDLIKVQIKFDDEELKQAIWFIVRAKHVDLPLYDRLYVWARSYFSSSPIHYVPRAQINGIYKNPSLFYHIPNITFRSYSEEETDFSTVDSISLDSFYDAPTITRRHSIA